MRYTTSLSIRVLATIILLLIPVVFSINIFQIIFEKVTLNLVYLILKAAKMNPTIGSYGVKHAIALLGGYTLNIVKYCVTASAYFLLTTLTILVHDVSIGKKIKIILFGYAAIFAMNIVRILFLLVTLIERGPEYFNEVHDIIGTILAIAYVIVLWFVLSILMDIKTIPIITDIKILVGEIMKKNEV